MKNRVNGLIPLSVLAILLLSVAPMAFASTLTVNLNPKTNLAKVTSASNTKIVLTYPVNSSMSKYLNAYNSTLSLSGSFNHGSDGAQLLQSHLHDEDERVTVQNMSASLSYSAKGNKTAFVLNKETDITAWVSGVFNLTNGKVTADLKWRSFSIPGTFNLNLENHDVDVNEVGSAMSDTLGGHALALGMLSGMFEHNDLWHRPTIDFSVFNSNLSTWTKNYISLTNTTTFSKTIAGQSNFTASESFNGQKYTLSAFSDPSSNISVQGYAVAKGNSIVIESTPALLSPITWVAAVALIAVAAGAAYAVMRSRAIRKPNTPSIPTSVQ
jgi:hypothetical protein